ncbi:uncharacterized protein tmem196 [Scleropages formosus]|uniref:uncharacterized protein tmem196 n=1 Tax=Scleropages formosus TaxID=113540 RepID=UPI0010FAC614|nr:transmembrane protein 196 [Scleropages formosus]
MCTSRKIIWSLLLLSLVEIGLGVSSIALGAVGVRRAQAEHKTRQGDASPVWSGFLICGLCGVLCAKKRTGLIVSISPERQRKSPFRIWTSAAGFSVTLYDIVFSLLHLRAHWRHLELPVCAGAGEEVWHVTLPAPGHHVPGLPGHQQLHPVHLAHLSSGQQRAAADVPGARAFAAPLPRDDRQGRDRGSFRTVREEVRQVRPTGGYWSRERK